MQAKQKTLTAFDDVIADMLSNQNLNPKAIELFIRGGKLNISLVLLHNLILLCWKILAQILIITFF